MKRQPQSTKWLRHAFWAASLLPLHWAAVNLYSWNGDRYRNTIL